MVRLRAYVVAIQRDRFNSGFRFFDDSYTVIFRGQASSKRYNYGDSVRIEEIAGDLEILGISVADGVSSSYGSISSQWATSSWHSYVARLRGAESLDELYNAMHRYWLSISGNIRSYALAKNRVGILKWLRRIFSDHIAKQLHRSLALRIESATTLLTTLVTPIGIVSSGIGDGYLSIALCPYIPKSEAKLMIKGSIGSSLLHYLSLKIGFSTKFYPIDREVVVTEIAGFVGEPLITVIPLSSLSIARRLVLVLATDGSRLDFDLASTVIDRDRVEELKYESSKGMIFGERMQSLVSRPMDVVYGIACREDVKEVLARELLKLVTSMRIDDDLTLVVATIDLAKA